MANFRPGTSIIIDLDLLRRQRVALQHAQQAIKGGIHHHDARRNSDNELLDGIVCLLDFIEDAIDPPTPGINSPGSKAGGTLGDMMTNPGLKLRKGEPVVTSVPTDVLSEPEKLVQDPLLGMPHSLRIATGKHNPVKHRANIYLIGTVDHHDASFRIDDNRLEFLWGCRSICSEQVARCHWAGGMSTVSGERRPHADALVNYVASVAAFHGWRW